MEKRFIVGFADGFETDSMSAEDFVAYVVREDVVRAGWFAVLVVEREV